MKRFFRPPFAGWLAGGCLLVTTGLLPGCKKDRSHTSAEGVVIDATTQARVAGARVYLLQTKGTSLYASASRVQHVDADNLGKFSLSFEAEDDSQYDLQATAPTFFDTPNGEYTGLIKGEKNKKNVTVRPEAWLRIHLFSQSPGIRSGLSLQTLVDIKVNINGINVDSSIVIHCRGNSSNLLGWWLYPGDGTPSRSVSQTIYCPAHDTTDFTIRF